MWEGYRIQIAQGWKWQGIFSYKWVRFARADKYVALQYHYRSVRACIGSDPIHRDVFKIIKLFAQNLRRHFFVRKRERYYTLRLAHVFGCYELALAVRNNA